MQVKKQQLEPDMEQWTGSKLGKMYIKSTHCQFAYLNYMQSERKSLSRVLLFAIPWTIQSLEFSRPDCWGGLLLPSRWLSQPRDRTQVSCIVGEFFTSWATREAPCRAHYVKWQNGWSASWHQDCRETTLIAALLAIAGTWKPPKRPSASQPSSRSVVSDSATLWNAARQASLSITSSRSLLKLMPIESVMPSSHFILCRPLLLLPPIPPSVRVFSNESTLHMRWPKYWSFSFSISPSNEHPGLISCRMDWLDLLAVQGTLSRWMDKKFVVYIHNGILLSY